MNFCRLNRVSGIGFVASRILHGQAAHRKSATELENGPSSLSTIDEYTEDGEFHIPLKPTLLNKSEITRPMFRGDGRPSVECVGVEDEDLIEIGSLGVFHSQKIECYACAPWILTPCYFPGNQYKTNVKWSWCKTLWENISVKALQTKVS